MFAGELVARFLFSTLLYIQVEQKKKKKRAAETDDEEESEEDADEEVEQVSQDKRQRKRKQDESKRPSMKKTKLAPGDEGYDPYDFDQQEDEVAPGNLHFFEQFVPSG